MIRTILRARDQMVEGSWQGRFLTFQHLLLNAGDMGTEFVKVQVSASFGDEPLLGSQSHLPVFFSLSVNCHFSFVLAAFARVCLRLVSAKLSLPFERYATYLALMRFRLES